MKKMKNFILKISKTGLPAFALMTVVATEVVAAGCIVWVLNQPECPEEILDIM